MPSLACIVGQSLTLVDGFTKPESDSMRGARAALLRKVFFDELPGQLAVIRWRAGPFPVSRLRREEPAPEPPRSPFANSLVRRPRSSTATVLVHERAGADC